MPQWICGSTFFVRAGPATVDFFKKVALLMTRRQSPDSAIMTYLCGAKFYKCATLPRCNSQQRGTVRPRLPDTIDVDVKMVYLHIANAVDLSEW
ncbi:hypothetical protein COOONC_15245 [Cooperia oncophora]